MLLYVPCPTNTPPPLVPSLHPPGTNFDDNPVLTVTTSFYTNTVLGSPPSQAICLASATLTMAQTPLNAACGVALVANVFSVLYFTSARSGHSSARTILLIAIPYLVFFICVAAVLTVGITRPELVGRATFYCIVRSDVL